MVLPFKGVHDHPSGPSHLILVLVVPLLLGGGVLVLLVLRDQVVGVGFGLRELHLVHALAGVPVQEGLPPEHDAELVGDPPEDVLHRGGVPDESRGEVGLGNLGRDVAHRGLDVVGDPLHEVRRVLVLHLEHLVLDVLGGDLAPEKRRGGEVPAVPRVGGCHHVASLEDLLGEVPDGHLPVRGGGGRAERREPDLEEVKAREGDEVHPKLPEVGVELAREAQAARDPSHDGAHEVVQVTEGWVGHLQGLVADVVQRLVVNDHDLVCVLDELVHGQGGVVGLHHHVRDLWRREDGVGHHDAVGVLLTQLGQQEGSHARPRAASDGVHELESLEAVAVFDLLAGDVQGLIDQLGPLGVVALGPVVAGAGGSADGGVRLEERPDARRVDFVQDGGLEVQHDRARDVPGTARLGEVDVDVLLEDIGRALVDHFVLVENAVRANLVLRRDGLPELGSNLVAGLASLEVNDLAHGAVWFAVMGAGNERLSTVLSNGGCAQPARFFLRRRG
mmetsp:Transcript_12132/g.36829  ORF Transcript_12132/g.36829 Transcript_12132/m.36829 type:complete len:504 (-) Transcript_12132:8-1519(-)